MNEDGARYKFSDGDRIRIVGNGHVPDALVTVEGEPQVDKQTGTVTLMVRACSHPNAVIACNLWQCPDCGDRASILDKDLLP